MKIKTYATFGAWRSLHQARHAFQSRKEAERNMALLFLLVKKHEAWISQKLGRPVKGLRMLEVGLGQGMERARYFGIHNQVTGMDLDIIPRGFDLPGYVRLIQNNGWGRFLKTVGRKMIIAGPNRRAWARAVGESGMRDPEMVYGDICEAQAVAPAYDIVMSWSMFEHLADPQKGLENMIQALRPGGVLFASIHLYTANNGHHDIRAFTGREHELPPWGHLRPATRELIKPSAYLNQWRLEQWRQLFSQQTPGYDEHLENFQGKYNAWMYPDLRKELSAYRDEELYTVDAIYLWQKPAS